MIGLVRHFKVLLESSPFFHTPESFNKAMKVYDTSPVLVKSFEDGNISWDKCFASDLPRAIETAKNIYPNKKIEITPLLREVPLRAFTNKNIKLPSFIWHIGARIAWYKNKTSQPETKQQTDLRIKKFIEILNNENMSANILIVTHGFFMLNLQRHLSALGYSGKIDSKPQNGKLYILRKTPIR